ncbi:flagellar filament capping protein FliD [Sporomusa termitida]|uniref:Flagellar hook-associated protein 2 C-terminal domain-containing protein n=1 Tax=Sporomusa termitida TaxID=2377 RepID=A0A517DX56_9FIRM|nr:flagellar filament capping protein FliD [Sporomusa termitida]QDR81939.1 hypothetical protein SPTER_33590 [Sporomusa termitida]
MAILPVTYRTDYQQSPAGSGQPRPGSAVFYPSTEAVNKEVAGLNTAATNLQAALKNFAQGGLLDTLYEISPTDSVYNFKLLSATDRLVSAYNQTNEALQSYGYLNSEGAKLLQQVQAVLQGPAAAKFESIGLTLDQATGNMKFSERRFREAAAEEPAAVRQLLAGDRSLVPVLNSVVQSVVAKQAKYYFNSSFVTYV